MYQVLKNIHFSYAHRLIHHPGKCARYHGHNAVAEIVCQAQELDQNDMVVDFDRITADLKQWINDTIDHVMILNKEDALCAFLEEKKQRFFIFDCEPTAEAIAKLIYDEAIRKKLPVKSVTLWETPNSSATYQAS